jgi:hypothetical protein
MIVPHHLTEDDLADYLIENDPAFKTRMKQSFDEYSAHGGVTVDAMIEKLKRRLPHTPLPTSKW